MSETPQLSIIIPAYNEEALLPAALDALAEGLAAAGMAERAEIIVSDNGSTDGTVEIARQRGARVAHEARRNIAAVRNAGARLALGEWLIFTDADSRVPAELLADTLAQFADPAVIGGGACVQMDVDSLKARWGAAGWNWLSRRKGWAAGGYIFCRREDFEALGGFDEARYAAEELDFSQRIQERAARDRRRFVILEHCFITSARKLDMRISWRERWKLLLFICGRRDVIKDPENCRYWYDVSR